MKKIICLFLSAILLLCLLVMPALAQENCEELTEISIRQLAYMDLDSASGTLREEIIQA